MGNVCYVPLAGGESVSFALPNPAAGADWLYTIPAGYEYEIRALQCKLICSLVVADRRPLFVIYDTAGNDHWRLYFSPANYTLAGETSVFSLYVGCQRTDYSFLTVVTSRQNNDTLPYNRLPAGYQIGTAFGGLDAADQWSEIRINALRWRV